MHRLFLAALLCALIVPGALAAPAEEKATPAPGSTPPAANEAPKNTLKWSTASEVDNFGYDVYRGEAEEGPFTRLTEKPLPGAGTTDVPSKYVFADDKIDPTKTYYYYVESISMDGKRERFTPVVKKGPKTPGAEAEPKKAPEAPKTEP